MSNRVLITIEDGIVDYFYDGLEIEIRVVDVDNIKEGYQGTDDIEGFEDLVPEYIKDLIEDYNTDYEEQLRRDEKNGLYPDQCDDAN